MNGTLLSKIIKAVKKKWIGVLWLTNTGRGLSVEQDGVLAKMSNNGRMT